VLQAGALTRQDSPPSRPQAPSSDQLVGRGLTRAGRTKQSLPRSDLGRLLRRTLAALESDLPALRAAELSHEQVTAFLAEQLAALLEPNAPTPGPGVSQAREPRAPGSSTTAAQTQVLSTLRQLERESPRGALLSVRELRTRSGLDKASFDRAALALAGQGRVSLHAHDHAAGLAESERRALIEDERGVHYVGIASTPDAHREVSL
jgi:hypothetical protein